MAKKRTGKTARTNGSRPRKSTPKKKPELGSLKDIFIDELKDLYSAENQIIKALPKMARAATLEDLRGSFQKHLNQTRTHLRRLDEVLKEIGESPGRKKCKGMEGLLEEGSEVMKKRAEPVVMDAALIAAAQRVEHYEMAGYGCVRTYALTLGYPNAAALLQQTLDEESETDKSLSTLAESMINGLAANPEEARELVEV